MKWPPRLLLLAVILTCCSFVIFNHGTPSALAQTPGTDPYCDGHDEEEHDDDEEFEDEDKGEWEDDEEWEEKFEER